MIDTEVISVGAVKTLIAKCSRLKAFIRDGDKEPLFDGAIYVYDYDNKSNKSYVGRIHVQIKSKAVDNPFLEETQFSISRGEYNAYLKEGGIVLFYVLISRNGEKNKVFYTNLLPYKINKLMEDMGNNNSRQTHCLPFPTATVEITDWAYNYLNDFEKQGALKQQGVHRMLSLDELSKSGQINHYNCSFTSSRDDISIFERLLRDEFYIYAESKLGLDIPVALFEGGERIIYTQINHEVE